MNFAEPIDRKHLLNMSDVQRAKAFEWAGGLVFRVYSTFYRRYLSVDGKRWVRGTDDAGAWALAEAYKRVQLEAVDSSLEFQVVASV